MYVYVNGRKSYVHSIYSQLPLLQTLLGLWASVLNRESL